MSSRSDVAGCSTKLLLTGAEMSLLLSMTDAWLSTEPEMWCELAAGHVNLHYALAQVSGPFWWWLRWNDAGDRRELVQIDRCEHLDLSSHSWARCTLFANHMGRHRCDRPKSETL